MNFIFPASTASLVYELRIHLSCAAALGVAAVTVRRAGKSQGGFVLCVFFAPVDILR